MTDIRIKQGTDAAYAFPLFNAAGVALDLTGYSFRSQVRSMDGKVLLWLWDTNYDNIFVSGNLVYIVWSSEETSDWTWSVGKYDLEVTSPANSVTRIASGTIMVSKEVTR